MNYGRSRIFQMLAELKRKNVFPVGRPAAAGPQCLDFQHFYVL
jgi:hypothetical protein